MLNSDSIESDSNESFENENTRLIQNDNSNANILGYRREYHIVNK